MIKKSEITKDWYKPGEIGKMVGLTNITIRNYQARGIIDMEQTPTGHNRASREEVIKFVDYMGLLVDDDDDNKIDVIYARVSSQDQKDKGDLNRQVTDLVTVVKDLRNIRVFTDVGSGLDSNRSGLQSLMKLVADNEVSRVFITNRDRLTRFGFEYLDFFFESYGVQIYVLNETENKTASQELVDDMMSLIASFSGRFYGLRSANKRKAREVIDEVGDIND